MRLAAVAAGAGLLWATPGVATPQSAQADAYLPIFETAYNLDFPEALNQARRAVAAHPDDAAAYRAVATVAWMEMVFRRGGTPIDHYIGPVDQTQFALPKPDPALDAEFQRAVDTAVSLADARVAAADRARPRRPNAEALYDAGAAWALRAAYAASIQGSVMTAFKAARHAYDLHEQVLDLPPRRVEANLTVGSYRYAVSTFALATRVVAYLAGFGGGREKGIAMIEKATAPGLSQADAMYGLAIIYTREGRQADAVRALEQLERRFPRNRLLVMELGAALIRAGRAEAAEAALTRGLSQFAADDRPKIPGEKALWLHKRGLARLNQNHQPAAAADQAAALAADPAGWVRGRIRLELGKLADAAGHRAAAIGEYHEAMAVCSRFNDPLCVAEADRYRRRPFRLQ